MQNNLEKRCIKLAKTIEQLPSAGQGIMILLALGLKENHDLYEKKFGAESLNPTNQAFKTSIKEGCSVNPTVP